MWGNKNFLLLMFGVAISSTGLWVGIIGNLEFLQKNVDSSFLQALILLSGFLVGVFLAPMAGRIIDRGDKKKILIYSGFARCLAIGFMYLAIAYNNVWWMLIYTFVIGISGTFSNPAMQTLIPLIVKKEDLLQANGVYMNLFTGARIAGTALGGVMLVGMSLSALYTVTLVSYVILLIATFYMKVDVTPRERTEDGKKESFFGTLKDLYPIVRDQHKVVYSIFLLIPPYLFLSGFNLMVIEISQIQHYPGIKGILYTTEGLCVFLGTYLAKRFLKEAKLPYLFGIVFISALAHISLFMASHLIMSVISFGFFGLAMGLLFPVTTTIFQTDIPAEYHGRFFSIKGMTDNIIFQILMLLTGLFLDTIGFEKMVITFGVCSFIIASLIFLQYRIREKQNSRKTVAAAK
ncbi:Major Facilitator Superfamily protein [Fictibacillus solisalsi]|uniref:Major Facilitator Superfamily protein n=1 Tax=Fictibacillus solisalsi TaxID=459525 RepID=A0A1G9TTS5_9BACL|nr:MFS transporter [Fictibacillus solisalsi]SDM50635.1 Major Facilitator Superfamily protein [Fictibacillus solisalsi]